MIMYGISDDNIRSCSHCLGDWDMGGRCPVCNGPEIIKDDEKYNPLRVYLKRLRDNKN